MFISVNCRGEAEIGSTLLKLTESSHSIAGYEIEAVILPEVYMPLYFGPPWQPSPVIESDQIDWPTWRHLKRKRFILFPTVELDPLRYIEFVKCLSESIHFTNTFVQRLLNSGSIREKPEMLQLVIKTRYHSTVHLPWYRRILLVINDFIHLYETMAWLSTLGGAYSAMGDYDDRYAEVAKKISMKQLRLALASGDPTNVSRCRIFIAMSAMQFGMFSYSKKLLLMQWEFAQSVEGQRDPRLKNMVLGTWELLKYKHKRHKLKRTAASTMST